MCKHGDVFSLQILIGRSLFLLFISVNRHLSSLFCLKVFKEKWVLPLDKMDLICYNLIIANAPLAQLVEQLTLNQWVLGSSPRWCTNHGRPVGQAVKTPPSHGGITSSSLVRVTIFL